MVYGAHDDKINVCRFLVGRSVGSIRYQFLDVDEMLTLELNKRFQYQGLELAGSRGTLVPNFCNRRYKYSSILSIRETISF
jgi:hypothetical protein